MRLQRQKRRKIKMGLALANILTPIVEKVIGSFEDYTPNRFINPVIQYMTDEWYRVRLRIVKIIHGVITGKIKLKSEAVSSFAITDLQKLNISNMMKEVLDDYKINVERKIADQVGKAKTATIAKFNDDGTMSIGLSRESLDKVIKELSWQTSFIDDVHTDTLSRVTALMNSRYQDLPQFTRTTNQVLRLDRDVKIKDFQQWTTKHADDVITGKITPEIFETRMGITIENYYNGLYAEGKRILPVSMTDREKDFVRRQADSQKPFLKKFREEMELKQSIGEELTSKVVQRANLYAQRGSALFEAGYVQSLPDDILLDWVMSPAEHCSTCPTLAAGSPYGKNRLPGYPGEGFHFTKCGVNCQCKYLPSKLYVTQLPGMEEIPDFMVTPPEVVKPVAKTRKPRTPKVMEKEAIADKEKELKSFATHVKGKDNYGRDVWVEGKDAIKSTDFVSDPSTGYDIINAEGGGSYFVKSPNVIYHDPALPKSKTYPSAEDIRKELSKLTDSSSKVEKSAVSGIKQQWEDIFDAIKRSDSSKLKDSIINRRDYLNKLKVKHEKATIEGRKLIFNNKKTYKMTNLITEDKTLKVHIDEKKFEKLPDQLSELIDENVWRNKSLIRITEKQVGSREACGLDGLHLNANTKDSTYFHEVGHYLADINKNVRQRAIDFYDVRTKGEVSVKLKEITDNIGYADHEISKLDKFLDPYMGKVYGGGSNEIVSMGVQMLYEDPITLAELDPDYFDFIYNLVKEAW